ncbi:Eco57I restriction-modification methylase domain-containing protein [Streptomyces antimycoticus]|uniref:Eco57I restriction-modification methylase domain-containing protein n=1 Tax=Streptomyces antimycoticus TaxID=68175 RepID=UPI000D1AC4A8|nr:DNA methyltransferase [Streptomyces antimycoticus]
MSPAPRSGGRRPSAAAIRIAKAADGKQQHLNWLNLTEVSGPFLTLPVLLRNWPQLEGVPKERRADIRLHHGIWQDDRKGAGRLDWIGFLLRNLLEWDDALHLRDGAGLYGDSDESTAADDALLDRFAVSPPGADTTVRPDFALVRPGTDPAAEPDATAAAKHLPILGLILPPDTVPTRRIGGDAWSASGVDRLAHVLRHHGVELGLVTDGRWWSLVWAPPGGVTTSATFDTIAWNESADLVAVRAWVSLLRRGRFFGRPEDELLPALLRESLEGQEDVTEALGIRVRQAVELLVDSIGRAEARMVKRGGQGLSGVPASEVYRGAVAVMMRVVFLLFAEERGLLPADNELYAEAYSAGRLYEALDERRRAEGEDSLDHTTSAWHRLIALFHAVHGGVDHPLLKLPAYDGSIFDPKRFPWLEAVPAGADGTGSPGSPGSTDGTGEGDAARAADGHASLLPIDDRTVLHVLDSVQFVVVNRERRRLTFRALDVEQIGYVYEGLLSYDGKRARDTVLGFVGKPGLEHEVGLAELELLAAPFGVGARAMAGQKPNLPGLSKKLYEHFKDPKPPATASKLEKLLAPGDDPARGEAMRRLLAVTENDRELAERILPFHGLLRDDLRGLPVVIPEDGLYVTESRLRKNTGTHYTPRALAQRVAEGALEPLVYRPGPLQTADDKQWKLIKPKEILKLKVADIAMGSAAFLVAACRYLAERLVDAWVEEEDEEALAFRGSHRDQTGAVTAADAESDPVMVRARRLIIEHCLYGVDINPMAVEMAKLSLWLISMDPERPFTFLDDRLVAGDSLLGITSLEQLEVMDLDARRGRERHKRGVIDFTAGVRELVHELAEQRKKIGDMPGETLENIADKRAILADVQERATRVNLLADLTAGAALASHGSGPLPARESMKKEMARRAWSLKRSEAPMAAAGMGFTVAKGLEGATDEARALAREWLATDLPEGGFEREPVHWPLVFPEVFEGGGFDAVIGNPPFLGGQKLTGAFGEPYREYLVFGLGRGRRGSADLVAYFELRAHQLNSQRGQTGLIATNTLAQGDTREVALDQLLNDGVEVRQAVKSAPWPSKSAALEYCAVWTTKSRMTNDANHVLNETIVQGITSSLDPRSRVSGSPYRLAANRGKSFQGSNVLGKGFILSHEEAQELIALNPNNKDVLFSYLNGEDLNSQPDCKASRQVINFQDWSEERARSYPEVFAIVERDVKPERLKNNRKVRRERWWQFAERAPNLYQAIAKMDQVLVVAQTSRTQMPIMVRTDQVLSHMIVVMASDSYGDLAFRSSNFQYVWTARYAAGLKGDLRFIPSDCFETLPAPQENPALETLGRQLADLRKTLMLNRHFGLTQTYNLVHDSDCCDDDVEDLRTIHRAIDEATARAYGWDDLLEAPAGLDHGFHETDQGIRYTIGLVVRTEIIDRLRELNHERYAAEVAAGLHGGKSGSRAKRGQGTSARAQREAIPGTEDGDPATNFVDDGLFPPEDALF